MWNVCPFFGALGEGCVFPSTVLSRHLLLQSIGVLIVRPAVSFLQHRNGDFENDVLFFDEDSVGRADVVNLRRGKHLTFTWVNAVALEALSYDNRRGVHALPILRAAAFRTKGLTTLFENKSTTTSQVASDGAGKPAWSDSLIRFFLSMLRTVNCLSPNSSILSTIFTALKKRFCRLYGFGSVSKRNLFFIVQRPHGCAVRIMLLDDIQDCFLFQFFRSPKSQT